MPGIQLQLSQYLSTTRRLEAEARQHKEEALNIQQATKFLTQKKAQLLQDKLRITIGFCKGLGKRLKRPFVAWYDHGLKIRFVLTHTRGSLSLVPWKEWKKHFHVLVQFDAPGQDLLPGMTTLKECLCRTKDHRLAIIKMLHALDLSGQLTEKSTVRALHDHLETHPNFHEAEPRNYLEDITDYA